MDESRRFPNARLREGTRGIWLNGASVQYDASSDKFGILQIVGRREVLFCGGEFLALCFTDFRISKI
jgi:hypothetical protein